ncbi:MAG: efflux RND transporter permease subunit [Melioribacteraceae bacterium]|nr:efflux RND transporter permease subunit [Melioribacteraceae bacterium]
MKNVIEFFTKYKVWTNVVLFSVVGFGLLFFYNMRYSSFPEIPPDVITIQVVYPGASPEEVEEGVILKIEENIDGIEGIERITSTSRENFGTVSVELIKDTDLEKALNDVKNAVDRISSFPIGAEKPIIFEQKFRTRAISVVLYGDADLFNLKYMADQFRDKLLATEAISQVNIEGVPNIEFSIEVSEENLRKYGLTFDEIARVVGATNINISGGKFDTTEEEILIRAYGKEYQAKELANLVIRGNRDGSVIYLKDIAKIKERWEDVPDKTYYNNRPAIILNIDKTDQEDILEVASAAKALVNEFNETSTEIEAFIIDDNTISLTERIELLVDNGIIGLTLVIITLGFFLNLRLSFWVAVGIPFSFAGMFIVAALSGITINVISLFGMIIVVGILVDDGIVVAENIYAHYEKGKPALEAAIIGTKEMVGPVFTSILTTVIAFLPFFFLDGFLGKFIWHMALVVIAALLFSLVEAFLILPAHLAHSKGLHAHSEDSKIRKKIEGIINFMTYKLYAPSLRYAIEHKWITVVLPISMVLLTIGLLRGGFIGVTFFPFIDGDNFPINVSLVAGRQEEDTDDILQKMEKATWEVNEDLKEQRKDGKDVVLGIKRDIGSNDFGESGSNAGKLTVYLLPGEERNMDSYLIGNMVREKVGLIPEAQNTSFGRTSFFGKPISISILGSNLYSLNKAKDILVKELENYTTLKDVTESNQEGRRELNIKLKPSAYALGLTLRDVAGQVRQGFFGQEVQRIQRGRDEIKVWVRYSDQDRTSVGFLDQMRIKTASGAEYPFSEVAEYKIERGITSINRLDRQRELKVEADLADQNASVPEILNKIQDEVIPIVAAQVGDVRFSFEGQSRSQDKVTASMRKAFPIALVAMFIVIVLVFRSYLQAGLVFSLIPLAILGAAWGHGILGIKLNTLSIYGLIALTGIVVNDSIVFIDQINRNLKSLMSVKEAVFQAGIARLRPILLTTLTTAAGLGPIILETSRQAQFLIPMAVSVAFGLVFGTFVLLVVLPAGFLVLNKLRYFAARFNDPNVTYESVEPAVKELAIENISYTTQKS